VTDDLLNEAIKANQNLENLIFLVGYDLVLG